MRINNNIMAINTHRQYGINNSKISKSTEKLSSGYRINRAGDDAAGLAISEKMRAQIRGLTMASKNSQDAISLVQTAEGALQETHNILQRMRELAVQSASDSNEQTIDRAALQAEFAELQKEINDISTTTRFNDQNLLDGTFQKILNTANTATTTLTNVNALSVTRAGAGEYEMSVVSTAESPSVVTAGKAAWVLDDDMDAMAAMSNKVTAIKFEGLETSDHDGNTYTLKVTGSDTSNMTFQLLDTNGDVVSTAQNVDTSVWKAGAGEQAANIVNFKGVGTLTFNMKEAVTNVTDLDSLSGAKMNFIAEGTYNKFKTTLADAALADVNTELAKLSGGTVTASYKAPAAPDLTSYTSSDTAVATDYDVTLKYGMTEDGTVTVSVMNKAGVEVAKGSASAVGIDATKKNVISLGKYGSVELENTGAATSALPETTYDHKTDVSAVDVTALQTAITANTSGDTITVSFETGSSITANTSSDTAPVYSLAFEIDGSDDLTVTVMQDGVATTMSASLSLAATFTGAGSSLDLGAFGKIVLKGTGSALTVDNTASGTIAAADVTQAANGAPVEKPAAQIASLTDKTAAIGTGAADGTEDLTGGKAQVTTMASRASMTLTINGEAVVLHKGDTYANFADQGISFSFDALSDEDILNSAYFGTLTNGAVKIAVNATQGKSLVIQSGANEGDELAINVDRISTETLGLSYSNISTRTAASKAITEVNDAINQVSTQRAALGALQNRLNHKIANLDTSAENLQAAESRIRDVDMAKEMTEFTKNNILFQASTAMLAQANAAPQGVLQLLG